MIYVFHLLDKPQGLELRQRVRPEHKAYLAAVADRILAAAVAKGVVHKNTAARKFSRLTKRVTALG